MSTGTGANVSKANVYGVVTAPTGEDVSKANAYAVLWPPIGASVSKANVYAVITPPLAPSWSPFSFSNGVVGVAYSQSFSASGSATITYSLLSGSLPPGLTLNSTGSVTGTPTTVGTYTFTIRATNSFGTADQPSSITIFSSPTISSNYGWSS